LLQALHWMCQAEHADCASPDLQALSHIVEATCGCRTGLTVVCNGCHTVCVQQCSTPVRGLWYDVKSIMGLNCTTHDLYATSTAGNRILAS